MPTTTTPKSKHTAEQEAMLKEFRTLVAEFPHNGTGGKKAPVTKRINKLTVRMILSGLRGCESADQVESGEGEFVYFVTTPKTAEPVYNTTPSELVELIAKLRAMSADNSVDAAGRPYPPIVRATAATQLEQELKNAETRGIDPDAAPDQIAA